WRVQCVDAFGIGANSSIRDLIIDATAPQNANLTLAKTKIDFGKSIKLTCDGADAISNDSNATLYIQPAGLTGQRILIENFTNNNVTFTYTETRTLGFYDVNCSVVDRAGNQNSTTLKFEVVRALSGSDLPAALVQRGKERVATIVVAKGATSNLGEIAGATESRLTGENAVLKFTVEGETHSITVKEVTETHVVLIIESEPQEVTVNKGETKEVDTNGDGTNDVRITYHGPDARDRADMTVEGLAQSVEGAPETPRGEEEVPSPAQKAAGSTATIIIVIVIIVIIVIGYFIVKRKK
ncbi:MAG: hypothetical protein AABX86_01460, partial [Nanoarchaeota archaeon]